MVIPLPTGTRPGVMTNGHRLLTLCLVFGLACFVSRAGEPGPEITPAGEGPELGADDVPADSPILPRHVEVIERYLMQAVAKDISSDDAASLRHIRDYLRGEIKHAHKPSEEEQALIDDLRRSLQERIKKAKHPRPVRERLAMVHLLREDWETALKHLRRLGPASRRDIYHPLLLAYVYLHLGDYRLADEQLAELDHILHSYRALALSHPAFCSEITAYRLYTPTVSNVFHPSQDTLVYVELSGVSFVDKGGGLAACDLAFGLTIKDDTQRVVWSEPNYGPYRPTFRGPVRDMHASVAVRIPNHLVPGRYHLFVHCRDNLGKKEGSCAIAFQVTSRERRPHSGPTDRPPAQGGGEDEDARRLEEGRLLLQEHNRRQGDTMTSPRGP